MRAYADEMTSGGTVRRVPRVQGAPGRLLGRTSELDALVREVAAPEGRLVTLTGPPGVGKTSLASTAASATAPRFANGTAFVDLSAAATPDDALLEICHAVDSDARSRAALADRVARSLRGLNLLLVLDNCESVPDLGPEVTALLRANGGLRVLATSRERLRVGLEREFPVPPLAMPGASDVHDLGRLGAVPAVEMLVQSTRRIRPGFDVDAGNAAAVAAICRELEGLPLALEVAAARLGQFSPAELAARLHNRALLLDGEAGSAAGRHRTLRAAISWSHDMLPEEQRILFRRASVFPGPWTLVAAEAIVDEPGFDLLRASSALVEKNLLRHAVRADGTEACDMLASLRQYAADELVRRGELESTMARHRTYYAGLSVDAEAGFGTPDEALWQDWVGVEQANLRAALTHSLDHEHLSAALPLATALGWFCYTRGHLDRAHQELHQVIDAVDAAGPSAGVDAGLAGAVLISGILAGARHDLVGADVLLRRAVELSERRDDSRRAAIAHAFLGHVARADGRPADAEARHARAAEIYDAAGNERGTAWSRHDLGLTALDRDQPDRAEELLTRARDWFDAADDTWALACTRLGLAEVALCRGSLARAAELFAEAFEGYVDSEDLRGASHCVVGSAAVRCDEGFFEPAARLLEVSWDLQPPGDSFALAATASRMTGLQTRVQRALGAAVGDPGDSRATTRRRTPRDEAVTLARSLLAPDPAEPVEASPLTPRQRQVAGLVAAGGTNRQIARTLGIAEKTVEVHLSQIMGRLEVRSRAQVATHAVKARLHRPGPDPSERPDEPVH